MNTPYERSLPANYEAEGAVLGSILIDPDALVVVAELLRAEDFQRHAHERIFGAMLDLASRRIPADLITVIEALERRGELEDAGGASYVSSLANLVPTSANAWYYAQIVAGCAQLRRQIRAAGEIAALAWNEANADSALEEAERILASVRRVTGGGDSRTYSDVLDELLEDTLARVEAVDAGTRYGLSTGFRLLDSHVVGMEPGELIYAAGRPGSGKSAFVMAVAREVAIHLADEARRSGAPQEQVGTVEWVTLEMPGKQQARRLVAARAALDTKQIRAGFPTAPGSSERVDAAAYHRFKSIVELQREQFGTALRVHDTGVSLRGLRALVARAASQRHCRVLVVDQLDLIALEQEGDRRGASEFERITKFSRELKQIALSYNLTVLCLVQLNRQVEYRTNKRPMLADLRQSGQCLTGDTRIYLPDTGTYERLDSLVARFGDEPLRVQALNPTTWRLETRTVQRAFATGHKPVYRVRTRLGHTIRATATHPFLTVSGWVPLAELTAGARIAAPRVLHASRQHPTMSMEECALLGHMIGDGCTLPRHVIQYTTADRDLAEHVMALATTMFGDRVQPRLEQQTNHKKGHHWYQVYLPTTAHLTWHQQTPVAAWLRELGAFGLRSHEKRVPERLFAQPIEHIAVFLRALWSTDGHAHVSGDTRKAPTFHYATASRELAYGIQSLLLRFGITASVNPPLACQKGRGIYSVEISGKHDQMCFIDRIGVSGERKQDMMAKLRAYLETTIHNTNRDLLPKEVWHSVVLPARAAATMPQREMATRLGLVANSHSLTRCGIGRERALRIALVLGSAALENLASSDVYWDEVMSIEPDGEEDVYDLTVEGLHNFVADNLLVHNCEQDADFVWGLYRPSYYDAERAESDPVFAEFAELLVLKARDGVANVTVPLRYEGAYTRFTDWPLDMSIPQESTPSGKGDVNEDEAPARSNGRGRQNGNGGRMPYGDD